jgi:hypothetical protein
MTSTSRANRAASVPLSIRVVWGSALLALPSIVLRLMGGADEDRAPRRMMQILGARHLLQAATEWYLDGTAREIGICVDALHAATDIGFASLDRRWRRAAATDAGITTGFVVLGLIDSRPPHRRTRRRRSSFTLERAG